MGTKYSNFLALFTAALILGISGCDRESSREQEAAAPHPGTIGADAPASPAMGAQRVFEVIARDFAIEAPESMGTGWHTMRLQNQGQQDHFVLMYRLAEGKTIEDQRREVVPVFDRLMEGIRSGEIEKKDIGAFLTGNIPEWGLQMTYVGGVGLLAPGKTSEATFHVPEPGTYLLECYVKAPDGTWHTSMGMLAQVEVRDLGDYGTEPEADATIALTNEGIEAPDTMPAGTRTIRVDVRDDPESFMPYDVNLARLESATNLDDVVLWMDWSNVGGLRAPAPVEFVGGVEHMKAGNHGYMTVDLSPGRYLWISEVDAGKMHKIFTVE